MACPLRRAGPAATMRPSEHLARSLGRGRGLRGPRTAWGALPDEVSGPSALLPRPPFGPGLRPRSWPAHLKNPHELEHSWGRLAPLLVSSCEAIVERS